MSILVGANISTLALWLAWLLVLDAIQTWVRNPLRSVPAGHPLAHFTSLWMHWVRWRGIQNATLREAHDRLGPVVCLGPREISVNCFQGGLREVYGGGFDKVNGDDGYNWYAFFANFNGVDTMFSIGASQPHATRKRMMSHIYSKSFITTNPALFAQLTEILYHRFLPYLARTFDCDDEAEIGKLDMYGLLNATTMDIVSGYLFGLQAGSNLVEDGSKLAWWLDIYHSRHAYTFWTQEFPRLTRFVEGWMGCRVTPRWVHSANHEIEQWVLHMCQQADAHCRKGGNDDDDDGGGGKACDRPVVYQQLMAAIEKSDGQMGSETAQTIVASELLDHLTAGFETSAITLVYMIHELSKHVEVQSRLQQELSGLSPRLLAAGSPHLASPKAVDSLPLLHAVTWETLRVHSAIPGPQPRFTPPQGARLGPDQQSYFVPGGVRVSASAGVLHRNEQVYKQADQWRPDRWLLDEGQGREKRWFWAFGSGGRMCIGSHLAVYQIKYIIAALYSNYSTAIVSDVGMEQRDAYTAPPSCDRLQIQLSKLQPAAE